MVDRLTLDDYTRPPQPNPRFKEGDKVIFRGRKGVVVEVLRFSCRVQLEKPGPYGHICPLVSFNDLEVLDAS